MPYNAICHYFVTHYISVASLNQISSTTVLYMCGGSVFQNLDFLCYNIHICSLVVHHKLFDLFSQQTGMEPACTCEAVILFCGGVKGRFIMQNFKDQSIKLRGGGEEGGRCF